MFSILYVDAFIQGLDSSYGLVGSDDTRFNLFVYQFSSSPTKSSFIHPDEVVGDMHRQHRNYARNMSVSNQERTQSHHNPTHHT